MDSEVQDDISHRIANNILEFFEQEVSMGRLPIHLLPLQSGVGNIANAIIGGLADGPFTNVEVWTEVIQDTFLDFWEHHKLSFASATSVAFSPDGFKRFYEMWDDLKDRLVLRSQSVSNSPEIIRRLGVIAMNTPVEVKINFFFNFIFYALLIFDFVVFISLTFMAMQILLTYAEQEC